jgi:uncharacterized radical SAM superfamily Fe-S cluster-containing enzyme
MNRAFQSICPVCGDPIPASYVTRDEAVYVEKSCPLHGDFRVLASENAADFDRWMDFPSVTVPPRVRSAKGARSYFFSSVIGQDADPVLNTECPQHCGLCENHLMTACCVLLNVTQRCNQHCPYCFAASGTDSVIASGIDSVIDSDTDPVTASGIDSVIAGADPQSMAVSDPSLGEIEGWLDRLIELGEERKYNIQLSGGEPTVRDDLPEIIRLCAEKGFEYIQLNTNGRRLADISPPDSSDNRKTDRAVSESHVEGTNGAEATDGLAYARALKAAGLSTVFLQFDGVTDEVYTALRGEPLLALKQRAIENCGKAGLPVTLVPTVTKTVNLHQVGDLVRFMLANVSVIKGVHFQPASFFGRHPEQDKRTATLSCEDKGTGTLSCKIDTSEKITAARGDFAERVTMFAIMEELEWQTGGLIQKTDLAPISTGHPLCCFCASFMKEGDKVKRMSSGGSCCDEAAADTDPLETIRRDRDFVLNKWTGPAIAVEDCCCESEDRVTVSLSSCCGGETSEQEDKGTDTPSCCCGETPASEPSGAMGFDEEIAYFRTNMFTISGMGFMDATNLDGERLRRCRVQVFTDGERLVPFCGYYV